MEGQSQSAEVPDQKTEDDTATATWWQRTTAVSMVAFISYFSDDDATSLRVPPLPKEALQGKAVVCEMCGRPFSNVTNRAEWKSVKDSSYI